MRVRTRRPNRPGRLSRLRPVSLLVVAFISTSRSAEAAVGPGRDVDFSPGDITAFTAHTVDRGELRLGVGSFELGLLDGLNLNTYPLPWIALIPNANLKFEPIDGRVLSLSLSAGFLFTSSDRFTNAVSPSDVWMFPLETTVSVAIRPELELSLSLIATVTHVVGGEEFDEDQGSSTRYLNPIAELGGGEAEQVAVTSNLQLIASLYWQLSSDTIAFLRYRHLLGERIEGALRVDSSPAPGTSLEVEGAAGTSLDREGVALSLAGGYVVSWGRTHLLLGGGYGNWTLPYVNWVSTEETAFLEADLYFRF